VTGAFNPATDSNPPVWLILAAVTVLAVWLAWRAWREHSGADSTVCTGHIRPAMPLRMPSIETAWASDWSETDEPYDWAEGGE
jgi:hypothetical protein